MRLFSRHGLHVRRFPSITALHRERYRIIMIKMSTEKLRQYEFQHSG
jgi:hypothetical protein